MRSMFSSAEEARPESHSTLGTFSFNQAPPPSAAPKRPTRRIAFAFGVGDELTRFDAAQRRLVTTSWDATSEPVSASLRDSALKEFTELQTSQVYGEVARPRLLETSRRLREAYARDVAGDAADRGRRLLAASTWRALEISLLEPPNKSLRRMILDWAYTNHPVSARIGAEWADVERALCAGDARYAAHAASVASGLSAMTPQQASGSSSSYVRAVVELIEMIQTWPWRAEAAETEQEEAGRDPRAIEAWRARVKRAREVFVEMRQGAMKRVVELLEGQVETLRDSLTQQQRAVGVSWPHWLAADLVLRQPQAKKHALPGLVDEALEGFQRAAGASGGHPSLRPDSALLMSQAVTHALKGRVLEALQYLRAEVGDALVEAHIGEIFARAGLLHAPSLQSSPSDQVFTHAPWDMDFREILLTRYASQLALGGRTRHPRLTGADDARPSRRVAAAYLNALTRSTSKGRHPLSSIWKEALLSDRAEVVSEKAALRALEEAETLSGKESVVARRCRFWTARKCAGNAMAWAERAPRDALAVSERTLHACLIAASRRDADFARLVEQFGEMTTLFDDRTPALVRVCRSLSAARQTRQRGEPEWVLFRDDALRGGLKLFSGPGQREIAGLPIGFRKSLLRSLFLASSASREEEEEEGRRLEEARATAPPPRLDVETCVGFVTVLESMCLDLGPESSEDLEDVRLTLAACMIHAVERGEWAAAPDQASESNRRMMVESH